MHLEPFDLFGFQHLLTLSIAAVVIFSVSFYFRNKKNDTKYTAGIAIAVLLVVQVIIGMLNTFSFDHNWQEVFPLHMCDLSALAIAYYIWKRENCKYPGNKYSLYKVHHQNIYNALLGYHLIHLELKFLFFSLFFLQLLT